MLSADIGHKLCIAVLSLFIVILCRILWYAGYAPKSELFYQEASTIVPEIISRCDCLTESYIPTFLWGKNGHIQSILHTIFGRFGKIPFYESKRYELTAKDGSIISYDIFQVSPDIKELEVLIVIVPGFCNHSESIYIKAFSYLMTTHGYRVAVLNHTGALKSVELRRPRIFTYGQTDDLECVIDNLRKNDESKKIVALGFSLGGNILMKYLGEKPERQKYFHFAASVCQGYDIPECCDLMQESENLRFIYNYGLTRNMLKVILHHKDSLTKYCKALEPPVGLNWKKISSAQALHELDKVFTVKLSEDANLDEFYQKNSSSRYLNNIYIPMLILNAKDDPLIPEKLYKYPKSLIGTNPNVLFVVTPYGGHLGFFEGGYLIPNRISWMDRLLAEYINVSLDIVRNQKWNSMIDAKEI